MPPPCRLAFAVPAGLQARGLGSAPLRPTFLLPVSAVVRSCCSASGAYFGVRPRGPFAAPQPRGSARVGCGRRPPRAHPVAFSSHGLPRAPRALDRCSAGQSSTSVSRKLQPGTAKVSFLVTVIQNPTPAPVPEPIRLAPARSARGLFPPPVLLPSDLLQLWAEAACSKFVHASAAAAAAVLKVCRLHGF